MTFIERPPNCYRQWSVGIYRGHSPWEMKAVTTPAFTAAQVSDCEAFFVADPFMIRRNGIWYLYSEILPQNRKGVIALAQSTDLEHWSYMGIVLEEQVHLSYPHLVSRGDEVFMVPESQAAGAVKLYRATTFPTGFEFVGDLLQGAWSDPTLFFFQGRWWMFVCGSPKQHDSLSLFWADRLEGPWLPHPQNPLYQDHPTGSRPGGRVKVIGNRLFRPAQDCGQRYGGCLRLFEVTTLTPESFAEKEVTPPGFPAPEANTWNAEGCHHIDLHQLDDEDWVACVDGATWQAYP